MAAAHAAAGVFLANGYVVDHLRAPTAAVGSERPVEARGHKQSYWVAPSV